MVAISLQIEGQMGLTWPLWKQLVAAADRLGFAGLFRSDHFTGSRPPDHDSLETIVSLAYAADHTERIHFGPLVAPLSFRHPVHLARQAAALDDLSDGRMVLSLGAGWQAREHTLFGFDLGDVPERMARFAEGLEVVTRLLRSDEPVTFEGRFYHLREARLLPRPKRPGGPRILIGGTGPKRTLPLVARYADIWNALNLTPHQFRETSALLDERMRQIGREGTIRRTMMIPIFFGRTMEELELRLNSDEKRSSAIVRGMTGPNLPFTAVLERLVARNDVLVGTPDMIADQIRQFGEAGVEELMLQWFDLDDLDGLRGFAESVFPLV